MVLNSNLDFSCYWFEETETSRGFFIKEILPSCCTKWS